LDISFSLPPHRFDACSAEERLTEFFLSRGKKVVVSTAFDPAVTSHADVDRLLRTEPKFSSRILA
jgi:hypothetical protein